MLKKRKGFSLIEAAIVLGVTGLIIGGIWVSAAAVQNRHQQNAIADGMLHLQLQASQIMSPSMFPNYNNAWVPLHALFNSSGVVPPGFMYNGNSFVSPVGADIYPFMVCWGVGSSTCPMFGVMAGSMKQGVCINVLRRVLTLIRNDPQFRQIDVYGNTTGKVTYTKASDVTTATCPADFSNMQMFTSPL